MFVPNRGLGVRETRFSTWLLTAHIDADLIPQKGEKANVYHEDSQDGQFDMSAKVGDVPTDLTQLECLRDLFEFSVGKREGRKVAFRRRSTSKLRRTENKIDRTNRW